MVGLSITGGRRRHLLEGPREGTKAPVHRCVGDVNQVQCCALLGNLIIQVSFCMLSLFCLRQVLPEVKALRVRLTGFDRHQWTHA